MSFRSPHIIALGGSIVAPRKMNVPFLKRFRRMIKDEVRRGQRFVIVIGGGGISRDYQKAAAAIFRNASNTEKDTIGIRTTQLNAEVVRVALGPNVHPEVITSPRQLARVRKPIALASGWTIGSSTDAVGVRIAELIKAKRVIIAGKPAFVYERDPTHNPMARAFTKMTWKEYGKIISGPWRPGLSAPVDPVAARNAKRLGISAIVLDGTNLSNLRLAIQGKPFRGTTIQAS